MALEQRQTCSGPGCPNSEPVEPEFMNRLADHPTKWTVVNLVQSRHLHVLTGWYSFCSHACLALWVNTNKSRD